MTDAKTLGILFIAGAIAGIAIKKVVKEGESHGCGCTGAIETKEADCGLRSSGDHRDGGSWVAVAEWRPTNPSIPSPVSTPSLLRVPRTSTVPRAPAIPSSEGIPVADLGEWPINRDYYQTHAGLGHPTEAYYDSYNDFLPEYRFPAPWSPEYNPRDVYRGPDYTIQQTSTSGRLI